MTGRVVETLPGRDYGAGISPGPRHHILILLYLMNLCVHFHLMDTSFFKVSPILQAGSVQGGKREGLLGNATSQGAERMRPESTRPVCPPRLYIDLKGLRVLRTRWYTA